MASLRRNIASSLFANVWSTALQLAITPLQVHLLGIEAFGLIGFIATLQIVFSMFDLGLSSTLTRQIALDRSPHLAGSADLIRTATTIYWSLCGVVAMTLALMANPIALHWFKATTLSTDLVTHSLYAITLYVAARFPVALYSGILSGIQRLDVLNAVKIATTSLRLAGGIAVLVVWPRLEVFLWWTALNAVVEVFAYSIASRKFSGISSWNFGFSVPALESVWSFSLSMAALSMLGVVISQLDRLMLSKMLPLADLGYYTLAYSAASTVSLGVSAISSAMLPSFTSAIGRGAMDELRVRYDDANRVLLFIVGLIVFPLVFFGDTVLTAWVGADAARGAFRPLILLALGFWCSALLSNAYSLAIASGRPGVVLRLSAASALPYFVAMFFLLREGGASGAALGWLLLNMAYVVVLVPLVHRGLLNESARHWLLATFVPFAVLGVAIFGGARAVVLALAGDATTSTVALPALATAAIVYFAIAYRMLGPRIRAEISALVGIRGGRAASLER